MEQITPVLNMQEVQDKANEFAMKGALEALKDFYTGYDSPFKKALTEKLKNNGLGNHSLELPDIIALMNDSMSKEIDLIANEAVSKTFLPMMSSFLTRAEKEITMSQFLKTFIEETDSKDFDDVSIEFHKDSKYSWYNLKLTSQECEYEITLHEEYASKKDEDKSKKKRLQLLQLPVMLDKRNTSSYLSSYSRPLMMKVTQGDVSLELPFVKDVLRDGFVSFGARMIIAKTVIILDTEDFSEDMFPERCHCD